MNSILVNITDETFTGKVTNSVQVEFTEALVTVGEIIEKRVRAEVAVHNQQRKENFFGLVQPTNTEAVLNGSRQQKFQPIDAEKQVLVAKEAFERNGFFMLIDNLQAEDLEQTFLLHPDSAISFVKLTPLVGG